MSLSWRNSLALVLDADRVVVSRRPAGWRAYASAPERIALAHYQDSLTLLAPFLDQLPKGSDVDVVVSDRHARYALVPWSESVRKAADQAKLAAIRFEVTCGIQPQEWDIRVEAGRPNQPKLACALDQALLQPLKVTLNQRGLRLRSLKPRLLWLLDRAATVLPEPDGLLVSVEPNHCTFAVCKQGQWHSVRTTQTQPDQAQTELPQWVERERLVQGLPDEALIQFHAPRLGACHADWQALGWQPLTAKPVGRPDAVTRAFWEGGG